MNAKQEIEKCIERIFITKTQSMANAICSGHRYLGFRFPNHIAGAYKEAAYTFIKENKMHWEFLLVRFDEVDGGVSVESSYYDAEGLSLDEISEAVYVFFKQEALAVDNTYAWVARPTQHPQDLKLEAVSDKVTEWFTDNYIGRDGRLKKDFTVNELFVPPLNKFMAG